jgi:CubicO group peptidase (beta-lactamase class C family)
MGMLVGSAEGTFELASRVDEILSRRPAVGLAVAVMQSGRLEQFEGRGFADLVTRRPITEDTCFRIGSITKTFTALAVLQLSEQGLVDLDAPANRYLRSYRLVAAEPGFRLPNLRHLLTHTSGIPDVRRFVDMLDVGAGPWDARVPARSVPFGHRPPSLADFYAPGLEVVAQPGSAFAYSNHGFATLGQIIEDVTGMPLDRYLRERVFRPLGMRSTDLVRTQLLAEQLAEGYVLTAAGPRAVEDREWLGAGAGGAYSTVRDLSRYAAALVHGGANEHGSVLRSATLATMFERHYETDPALPAMGLGFFLADADGRRVVSHDGILPGFNSHLSLVPESGAGLIALTSGSSGAMRWLPEEAHSLMRELLGVEREATGPAFPHHPEIWSEIVGRYALPPRVSDLRGRLAMGGGLEVFIGGGRPKLRLRLPVPALWRGVPLQPDDANDGRAFHVDLAAFGMGRVRLRFRRDRLTGTTVIHTDLGGQPISFESVVRNNRRHSWALVAAAATAVVVGTAAVVRRAARRSQGRERRATAGRRGTS